MRARFRNPPLLVALAVPTPSSPTTTRSRALDRMGHGRKRAPRVPTRSTELRRDCVKKGAKWASTTRRQRGLHPVGPGSGPRNWQAEVTVKGKLDKDNKTIEVESLEPVPSK